MQKTDPCIFLGLRLLSLLTLPLLWWQYSMMGQTFVIEGLGSFMLATGLSEYNVTTISSTRCQANALTTVLVRSG